MRTRHILYYETTTCDVCGEKEVIERDSLAHDHLQYVYRDDPKAAGKVVEGHRVDWFVSKDNKHYCSDACVVSGYKISLRGYAKRESDHG